MNKKIIYRIINILCLMILIGTVIWLVIVWDSLPDEVAMHFNAAGEVDRTSRKTDIIILPIMSWLMYGIMVLVEHIPGAWNTGVKVTPENSARVYGIIKRMIVILKLLLVIIFTMMTIFSAIGKNMPVWFVPIELVLIFGNIIWHIISLYKNQ
ncbi:MAG: DUF1648 domain-containing protein [Lachnospiraceae bacterium]|nr:DUF1648 domain-containing protein [Lachnospiraceae bacterium]